MFWKIFVDILLFLIQLILFLFLIGGGLYACIYIYVEIEEKINSYINPIKEKKINKRLSEILSTKHFETEKSINDLQIKPKTPQPPTPIVVPKVPKPTPKPTPSHTSQHTGTESQGSEGKKTAESHYSISGLGGLSSRLDFPCVPSLFVRKKSFNAQIIEYIRDYYNNDAPLIYKRAKVSKQTYSRIISEENRQVSKKTAIAFALALHLDVDKAKELIEAAGFAFSPTIPFDVVCKRCLELKIYSLDDVNKILREMRVKKTDLF